MKLVSVVIPTRNRFEMVNACIDSILKSTYRNIEIIVVDDASTDGTCNFLKAKYNDKIEIISIENHSMMVKARNCGARHSKGDYVLFIDDDNIIDSEMIETLVGCARNKLYGIVGPKMYFSANKECPYLISQKINLWTGKTTGMSKNKNNLSVLESDGIPNVFMVKKEVFQKLGNFDERLIQTWTEPDFSFDAKKCGYKTVICQKASTYHMISPSSDTLKRTLGGGGFKHKAYYLTRNRTIIIKRYSNLVQLLFFVLTFSWIYPIVYTLLAIKHKELSIIPLYWHGFKDGLYFLLTNKYKNYFEFRSI